MPLKEGSSKDVISTNIEHCMAKYKETGQVSGNSVASTKKAMKICAAMAYDQAREGAKGPALSKAIKEKRKK